MEHRNIHWGRCLQKCGQLIFKDIKDRNIIQKNSAGRMCITENKVDSSLDLIVDMKIHENRNERSKVTDTHYLHATLYISVTPSKSQRISQRNVWDPKVVGAYYENS